MRKFNGRSVTGRRGSCLLCWMFENSLENLGKGTGECKNKPGIFENLRKSSKIFGKIGKCSKVLKTTFQHFSISYEISGNHRKSSDVFGNLRNWISTFQHFWNFFEIFGNWRKSSEEIGKCRIALKTIFRHFLKMFENFRKCSEMLEKLRKPSENFKM